MKTSLVYTAIDGEWKEGGWTLMDSSGEWVCNLKEQELITFTKTEFENFKNNFSEKIIKDSKRHILHTKIMVGNVKNHQVDTATIITMMVVMTKIVVNIAENQKKENNN